MTFIQVILVIFFVFAGYGAVRRYRNNELALPRLIIWLLFWLVATVVVILPNSTNYLAQYVGIGRGADLVVYISLALLFFLNFNFLTKLEKANREITKLTRAITLGENKEK